MAYETVVYHNLNMISVRASTTTIEKNTLLKSAYQAPDDLANVKETRHLSQNGEFNKELKIIVALTIPAI